MSLEDLQRVAVQYLLEQKPTKAVVAPMAKRDTLIELGFSIQQVQ